MNGDGLLDTNAVSALSDVDPQAARLVSQYRSMVVPSVALGEMYFGVWKSGRRDLNRAKVAAFEARAKVLPCDAGTAAVYGRIKDDLRRKGRPIPENDLWIAALAIQHGRTLISRDAHFGEVEGLSVVGW